MSRGVLRDDGLGAMCSIGGQGGAQCMHICASVFALMDERLQVALATLSAPVIAAEGLLGNTTTVPATAQLLQHQWISAI